MGIFALLGYERGLQWHSVRKGLEGIVLLAVTAGLCGQSLDKKYGGPLYRLPFCI